MPTVSIDTRQFSGEDTGLEPDNGSVWFWPYRPYVDDSALVSREIVKIKTADGLAAVTLPATPVGEAVWVQLRAIKGAGTPWLVVIPGTDCNLFDLPHVDESTLDPEVEPTPYWLTYMESAIAEAIDGILDGAPGAMDTLAELAAALGDDPNFATTVLTSLAGKVDESVYDAAIAGLVTSIGTKADDAATTTALGTKVNSATYVAGLALKADVTALTAEALARTNADALLQPIATLPAVTKTIQQTRDQKQARALRNFHVALGTVATTAVDALLVSDSIGEGANAGSWAARMINVVQDRVRRAVQPAGVTGGTGYLGFGGGVILSGSGFVGHTGSASTTTAFGLGRKSLVLQNAATQSFYFVGDACDMLYSTDPTYGSFTLTVNGAAQGGTTVCSGATSHGNKKRLTGTAGATNTVVVTSSGITALEGEMPYNLDTTVGFRMWEGAHSAYSSADFAASTTWADSVTAIPNLRLVLMTGNSNAYYAGTSIAQAKTDQLAMIAATRAKGGSNASYVLISYYDRPATSPVAPWADYVAMYDEIAAADPDVMHIDCGPTFGPLASQTDDRGGLTSNVDYVHPTPAGHALMGALVADSIIPKGSLAGRINKADVGLSLVDNTADASKPVSTAQAAAILAITGGQNAVYAASFTGAIVLSAFPMTTYAGYRLTCTGNVSFSATAKPTIAAGRTASFFIELVQDATGSRTLTLNANVLTAAGVDPVLSTAANAIDLLEFRWTGTELILTNFVKGAA